jgi:hypothetical protein
MQCGKKGYASCTQSQKSQNEKEQEKNKKSKKVEEWV